MKWLNPLQALTELRSWLISCISASLAALLLVVLPFFVDAQTYCLKCPSLPFDNQVMVGNGFVWTSELLPFGCAIQWDNVAEAFSCAAAGAPSTATYLVVSLDAGLSNERNFRCGSGITCTDSGANNPFSVSIEAGAITDAMLASNYSGVGACAGGEFVSKLNENAAPTCGTPSGGGWTDDGTEVRLTTSTDEVEIGSVGTLAAKLAVNGDSDETQLLVQQNATQTVPGFVYENSAGLNLVAIEGDGDVEIGSGAGGLHAAKFAVDGNSDEVQVHVQGNSTQTSNIMVVENSGLTDLLRVTNAGVAVGGSGAVITNILSASATLDFADPGQNNCTAAQTITVTNAAAGNPCFIGFAISVTDVWFVCQVTATNTCSIRACKVGNVAENPPSGTFRCDVFSH